MYRTDSRHPPPWQPGADGDFGGCRDGATGMYRKVFTATIVNETMQHVLSSDYQYSALSDDLCLMATSTPHCILHCRMARNAYRDDVEADDQLDLRVGGVGGHG
jgi:hypothetical protein